MMPAADVWKGMNGSDRSMIVERIFNLSKAALEWKRQCEEGDVQAWAWYGRLEFEVDMLREDLSEALGVEIIEREDMVTIDGQTKRMCGFESEVVVGKLDELGQLLEVWAEACSAGKAVAWIEVGRLAEYAERMWDQICWDRMEGELEA